jgi:hypothetical protein
VTASSTSQTVPRVVAQSETRHLGGAQDGQRLPLAPFPTALLWAPAQVGDDDGEQVQKQGVDEDQDIEQDDDETGGSEPSSLPASPPTLPVAKEPGQPNAKERKPRVVWLPAHIARLNLLLQDPACPRKPKQRNEAIVVMNRMKNDAYNDASTVRMRGAAEKGASSGNLSHRIAP